MFSLASSRNLRILFVPKRTFSNVVELGKGLEKAYSRLGLSSTCSKEELKEKYLSLVKQHHPDTGDGDADKFNAVRTAYRFIVDNDYGEKDKSELEDVPKIFDIRHTAPQHRQYLEFGGIGSGTPSERQRQYQTYRVHKATENVHEYVIGKIMSSEQSDSLMSVTTEQDAEYARRWKTRNAMDRLVEDLIQESMKKGEFDRLPGSGKPLKPQPNNPYLDTVTQKINEILVQNGFTPEWVLLEKEIRESIREIRSNLAAKRSEFPGDANEWSDLEGKKWNSLIERLKLDLAELNRRISHYNLVAPSLSRQIIPLTAERELKRIPVQCLEKNNEKEISEPEIVPPDSMTENKSIDAGDDDYFLKRLYRNIFSPQ